MHALPVHLHAGPLHQRGSGPPGSAAGEDAGHVEAVHEVRVLHIPCLGRRLDQCHLVLCVAPAAQGLQTQDALVRLEKTGHGAVRLEHGRGPVAVRIVPVTGLECARGARRRAPLHAARRVRQQLGPLGVDAEGVELVGKGPPVAIEGDQRRATILRHLRRCGAHGPIGQQRAEPSARVRGCRRRGARLCLGRRLRVLRKALCEAQVRLGHALQQRVAPGVVVA
mmetsp:Transcript_93740/g.289129  ORF Transcript_93740/g.289129 Transcript_93740/m.289129 type:complete len:224 (+) Transcript_93740:1119-1790(+)